MERPYFVGLDLGQSQDFTALAIAERVELEGAWDAARWAHRKMAALDLRYLERIPLRTEYPEVVERVRRVTQSGELKERCHLVVDGGQGWGGRWWTCCGGPDWGARCGRWW